MEDRRGKDDKMSRGMWKEVESWKADKTRMEETRRKGKKKRKISGRRRKNDKENINREEKRGRCDGSENNRRNSSKTVL